MAMCRDNFRALKEPVEPHRRVSVVEPILKSGVCSGAPEKAYF